MIRAIFRAAGCEPDTAAYAASLIDWRGVLAAMFGVIALFAQLLLIWALS